MRDPKKLAEYLELDYFRRLRPLRRWRRWVNWALLLVCVGALAWTLWPENRTAYQSAPVSSAHTFFNSDCAACHTQPFETAKRLWPGHAGVHAVSDEACSSCHPGPIHQTTQTHTPACASCHREHRGRPLLALVGDRHCTKCHADLQRHDGRGSRFQNVRDFASHPEFALVRGQEADPGRLRFNHQLHLHEDGVARPDGRRLKLDCQACHQIDAAGRYMQPLNFERHCAECHPLSISVSEDWKAEQLKQAAEAFNQATVPHREPAIVRAVLRDRLTEFVRNHPGILDPKSKPESGRPFPGRGPQAVGEKAFHWVNEHLKSAEAGFFREGGKCAYCHGEPVRWNDARLPEYAKTDVRSRWLPHSRFNHDKHRMLKCEECHAANQSRATADVLMPSVESCQQCHSAKAGVRDDCQECHQYHGPASDSDAFRKRTIGEALRKGT